MTARPIQPGPAGISRDAFARIANAYYRRWRIGLSVVDADGRVTMRRGSGGRGPDDAAGREARRHAVAEALRWGEPTVGEFSSSGRRLVWAVPLMNNARLLGGLVAMASERRVFGTGGHDQASRRAAPGRGRRTRRSGSPQPPRRPPLDIRRACEDLRLLAERENLTNAALLEARRLDYQREQKRAEAIHDLKTRYFHSIREVYLREEPALISAVRRGERAEARGLLNRVLMEIYTLGGDDLNVIKSFLMELVVTMCRTAVESGGDPRELLGANYATISELARVNTEEQLSHWVVQTLERIMDSIQRRRREPSSVLLTAAMKYLAEHFHENVSRDDLARVAGLSPPHFSRLLKRHVGRGFADLLNQLRIDRAIELLRSTDKGLLQIAVEVGFNDQSYFTKVFRRHTRLTPRQYRRQHRPE